MEPKADAHVGMTSGVAYFGERAVARQGVADECVPPVVNCKALEPIPTQDFTGRPEPFAERVAGERLGGTAGPAGVEKGIVRAGAVGEPFLPPGRDVGQASPRLA